MTPQRSLCGDDLWREHGGHTQPVGSPLADIDFKVTGDVGGTNLVFEVAVYSKDRVPYFTDGDISLDNGDTYTKDVLKWHGTAGKTQDVHLVWNWQRHNPDLVDWDGVTVTVTAKLQGEDVSVKCQNGIFVGVRDSVSGGVAFAKFGIWQALTERELCA